MLTYPYTPLSLASMLCIVWLKCGRKVAETTMTRIKGYDYSQPGFYCNTICVSYHRICFGRVVDGKMHLNALSRIAESVWNSLPDRFPHVRVDAFVCMLNHVHGIIELTEIDEAQTRRRELSWEIIRAFKGATTRFIRISPSKPWFAWQPSTFESILYNERRLNHARQYIYDNPARWTKDPFYRPDR